MKDKSKRGHREISRISKNSKTKVTEIWLNVININIIINGNGIISCRELCWGFKVKSFNFFT